MVDRPPRRRGSGEGFGEERPGGGEGALVSKPVVGDAGDRPWHGVLVGEAVHGPAVDDQLPVGPCAVHFLGKPGDIGHRHVGVESTVAGQDPGLDSARLGRAGGDEAAVDADGGGQPGVGAGSGQGADHPLTVARDPVAEHVTGEDDVPERRVPAGPARGHGAVTDAVAVFWSGKLLAMDGRKSPPSRVPATLESMVTVRLAAPDEAVILHAIAREAYQRYVPRIGREPAPMSADYGAAVRNGQAWVAVDQDQVIGFVVLIAQPDHLLLKNLAVRPSWQGGGAGSRLLALAEDQARRLRRAEIRLYTNEAMTENLAYYPRRGYAETHRAEQDGFRRVFFRKRIA